MPASGVWRSRHAQALLPRSQSPAVPRRGFTFGADRTEAVLVELNILKSDFDILVGLEARAASGETRQRAAVTR
jgi:hypothetical protein